MNQPLYYCEFSRLEECLFVCVVGVHELRQKMEAIPQDPVLFAGSVRFNLDPRKQHTDEKIWNVLERTYLKPLISSMDGQLDAKVSEAGSNLSIGQKQLICMARALLRSVRILLLDEATSSLDGSTDQLIQQCLSEQFKECTVLIIAHRLSSVMHCDKILFMDNGRVIEFDHPNTLLENPKSRFYQMMRTDEQKPSSPDSLRPKSAVL